MIGGGKKERNFDVDINEEERRREGATRQPAFRHHPPCAVDGHGILRVEGIGADAQAFTWWLAAWRRHDGGGNDGGGLLFCCLGAKI